VHARAGAPAVDDDPVPEIRHRRGESVVGNEEEEGEREGDQDYGTEGPRLRGLRVTREEVGGAGFGFDRIHCFVVVVEIGGGAASAGIRSAHQRSRKG